MYYVSLPVYVFPSMFYGGYTDYVTFLSVLLNVGDLTIAQ
jgi:hypothetical protein